MEYAPIEVRAVLPDQRVASVMVAPYGETSFLAGSPGGERFRRGAFTAGLVGRERKIKLLRGHDKGRVYGMSRSFAETPEGLVAEFDIRVGPAGDEMLDDLRGGFMDVSAGFLVDRDSYGPGGVRIIEQAKLYEVSAVAVAAYSDSRVLSTRAAHTTPLAPRAREPWETPRRWQ